MVLNVNPRTAGYGGEQAAALTARLLERLRSEPGVDAVSYSENGVMFGRDSRTNVIRPEGFVAGKRGYPRARLTSLDRTIFRRWGFHLWRGATSQKRDNIRRLPSSPSTRKWRRVCFLARILLAGG